MSYIPVPTIQLTPQMCEMAVLGGAILGGGSGGKLETGLSWAQMALDLGGAALIPLDRVVHEDAFIVIGAHIRSARHTRYPPLRLFHRAIDLIRHNTEGEFGGIVNCGSGALLTQVGWLESALTGVPLVDVVLGQGYHPSPVRGILSLCAEAGCALSIAYAGMVQDGSYLEAYLSGPAALLVREFDQEEGLFPDAFALAVGPVHLDWLKRHGIPGLVQRAMHVGERVIQATPAGGRAVAEAVSQVLGGMVAGFGTITAIQSVDEGRGGYVIHLWDDQNVPLVITYRHAYVELARAGETLARFPDLIVTLGTGGIPLSIEELTEGQDVYIVVVPAASIYGSQATHPPA